MLHHIWAKLGDQAEDVLGGEGFKTLPIHRMADGHIAGKVQQAVIHIFRAQLWVNCTGRKDGETVLPLPYIEVPFLYLTFDVLLQLVADLLPAHQSPQGIAEGDCFFIRKALQRQSEQIPFQQLIRKKRCSLVIPHHSGKASVIFTSGAVQDILDAEIGFCQHLWEGVRLVDQIVAVMYAVTLWQTHGAFSFQVC